MKAIFSARSPRQAAFSIEPLESRIAPSTLIPHVNSINRAIPMSADTGASDVTYAVTFDQDVTGVDATDFKVFTSVDAKATATVTVAPTANTKVFNVTVSGLQGNGDVRLDLVDDDTIKLGPDSLGGTGLNNGSFTGQTYHLLQTMPKVDSITANPPTNTSASSVSWTVTFSEGVTGVDATDFKLTASGPTGAIISGVTPVNGSNGAGYTVTANGFSGTGTIRLDLVDDSTITDSDNNPLQTKPVSFDTAQSATTTGGAVAVASGDLNGDGKPDLVVANYFNSSVSVLLGNGNGTFTAKPNAVTGHSPRSVAIGDVNGDGIPDLAVAASVYHEPTFTFVSVLLGNGDGTFQPKQDYGSGFTPLAVAIGDLNGDGRPDLAVSGGAEVDVVEVLLGNGNGTFQQEQLYLTGADPRSVAIGDVDGDGKPDVVTGNHGDNNVSVLLGTGSGTLGMAMNFVAGTAPTSVALGKLNGDGKLDIVAGNDSDGTVSVLLNTTTTAGTPTFAAKTDFNTGAMPGTTTPSGVAVADVNGDGNLDIVSTSAPFGPGGNPKGAPVSVLPGDGAGAFGAAQIFNASGANALGVAIADFNGDGKADIAAATTTFTPGSPGPGIAPELPPSIGSADVLLNNGTGPFTGETFTVAPPSVDPAITSISDGTVNAMTGDLLTYSIGYANNGTLGATGVTLTVPLDSHLFFVASENPGWSESGGTLTKTLAGTLGAGATGTEPLKLHVKQVFLDSPSSATTMVTISADGSDSEPKNNSASDTDELSGKVYSGFVVTAPGISPKKNVFALPVVRVFDRLSGDEVYQFSAYEDTYRDSIRVALGDFNDDGVDDIVTTTQHNGGRMRFFDGATGMQFTSGPLSEEIPVFGTSAKKGAFVAVGNVNGSGLPEIVVGSSLISSSVGGGTVKVYSLDSDRRGIDEGEAPPMLSVIEEFTPFGEKFKGGVRVAVGDVDFFRGGERLEDDIIVGQGFHGGTVKVYKGVTDTVLGEFKVGRKNFKGGVSVGAIDINNDGHTDILVGRNTGKPSVVEIFDGNTVLPDATPTQIGPTLDPFDEDPHHPKYTSGVRVASADVNGDGVADIIASVGIKKNSLVKFYDGKKFRDGIIELIDERTVTAFEAFPDVALWVAGSRTQILS